MSLMSSDGKDLPDVPVGEGLNDPTSDGSSTSSLGNSIGAKASDGKSMRRERETIRAFELTTRRSPSRRRDDQFEIRIYLSRKAVAFVIVLVVIFSRLVETLGVRVLDLTL